MIQDSHLSGGPSHYPSYILCHQYTALLQFVTHFSVGKTSSNLSLVLILLYTSSDYRITFRL